MYKQNYVLKLTNKYLNFKRINGRILSLQPAHSDYEIKNNDQIVGLNYDDEYIINTNKNILLDKDKFKIQAIKREQSMYLLYIQERITKSSTFIMPLLGYDKVYFRYDHEFINCFVGTERNNDYGEYIYLLYRFNGSVEFTKFEENVIKKHKDYIDTIDIDKYQVLYKFKINEKYKEDYYKILDGKYSTISKDGKERLMTFNLSEPNGSLYEILNKVQRRKEKLEEEIGQTLPPEAEVYSGFIVENEILLNKYQID